MGAGAGAGAGAPGALPSTSGTLGRLHCCRQSQEVCQAEEFATATLTPCRLEAGCFGCFGCLGKHGAGCQLGQLWRHTPPICQFTRSPLPRPSTWHHGLPRRPFPRLSFARHPTTRPPFAHSPLRQSFPGSQETDTRSHEPRATSHEPTSQDSQHCQPGTQNS